MELINFDDSNTTKEASTSGSTSIPSKEMTINETSGLSTQTNPVSGFPESISTTTITSPVLDAGSSSDWQRSPSSEFIQPAVLFSARSIKNKLPDLHHLIYTNNLSCVFISETWLNDGVTDSMLDPERRFNIYRKNRHNRPGGGTMAMIPTSFKSYEYEMNVEEQCLSDNCGCEILCVDIFFHKHKYRCIILYRPPSSCFKSRHDLLEKTSSLNNLITRLTHPSITTIVLGDFNLPKINWSTLEIPNDGIHDVIYQCFSSLGYTQFVHDVTHLSITGNSNTLDLIFSNDCMSINVEDITAPLGTSDHSVIHFKIFTPFETTSPNHNTGIIDALEGTSINLPILDWSSADYPAMNEAIHSIDWHTLFGYYFDANSLWNELKNILWPIISLYVPQKFVKHCKKYRPKQYPKHIRKLLTKKSCNMAHSTHFQNNRFKYKISQYRRAMQNWNTEIRFRTRRKITESQ